MVAAKGGISSDASAIVAAIAELRGAMDRNAAQTERLAAALETALRSLPENQAGGADVAAAVKPVAAPPPREALPAPAAKKTINWVIGPPDNIGWAYGNNAKRLSALLPSYDHRISSAEPSDLAIYFDALVAERFEVEAKKSILRIGGPRPLDRLFGNDVEAMRKALAKFDAIIALNGALYFRALEVHPNVHLIPNALDLKEWNPDQRKAIEARRFTVGFAASLKSSAEAEIKGYGIVKGAIERIGVPLLLTSKGGNQIPHDRMIRDFYAKIDVLVQPAAPGREGTSNVIMEALALGVPVLTTEHSGYHGEFLTDGRNALIRERDELVYAETLAMLQRDERLRRKIGSGGRTFAETHHDLRVVGKAYGEIIKQLLAAPKKPVKRKKRKIAFVPFWEPAENFGSSRLRALYPSRYVADIGRFEVSLGYADDADIVVIVQMCDDALLAKLKGNPNQFLIYDVCDKYYENPRDFKHVTPNINSQARFHELSERANLIIVPSRVLKGEIAMRVPGRAVKYVPEPIDYGAQARPVRPVEPRRVLWYGNPDRGNFDSAKWMIEQLRDQHGFEPLIVSRTSYFKRYPEFLPYCRDWSIEAMNKAFGEASVCVVAYDEAEQAKSPNRFIAAMMQGVPTLVANSPAVSDIVVRTGHTFANIGSPGSLDRAIGRLEQDEFRGLYVKRVQRHLVEHYGEDATAHAYAGLIDDYSYDPAIFNGRKRRVAFVSHNLSIGEGAPWSLFELVTGLRDQGIEVMVYAPPSGPLRQQYVDAGVPLTVFDQSARHAVKVLNTKLDPLTRSFTAFLKENEIEAVICNTVKASPFVQMAGRIGIPGAVIVRESYSVEERFSHFLGDARLSAMLGLAEARHVVFVAETSREKWVDQPMGGKIHVIPNGISPTRFAATDGMSKQEARAEIGVPADDVVALCVGTINARKGQGELMATFAELPPELIDRTTLLFLGAVENSQLGDFNRAHAALPEAIRAKVRVIEATRDVDRYYRAADMFLMNSSSEAYPRSIVEALLFALPVISTKVFGVTEQVTHGDSGFLYDFNDMAAWREHFTALVTDEALRGRVAAAASRAFWKLTGYQEMLLAYRAIIADMLVKR